VPRIGVRKGERVAVHLGFEPSRVTLTWFPGGDAERLAVTREPTWQVDREGAFALFADPEAGGDASYVACLRYR
jgi:hypothetical protein